MLGAHGKVDKGRQSHRKGFGFARGPGLRVKVLVSWKQSPRIPRHDPAIGHLPEFVHNLEH